MRLITDLEEGRACFDKLRATLIRVASSVGMHRAAFRPGGLTAETLFFAEFDIWAMLTDGSELSKSRNRYWNCFGIGGHPASASNRIVVEINHPHAGRSTVSGRFMVDEQSYLIGHTVRIGGGVPGSDSEALERLTGHQRREVTVSGRTEKLAFLARIDDPKRLCADIASFVRLMALARERLNATKRCD